MKRSLIFRNLALIYCCCICLSTFSQSQSQLDNYTFQGIRGLALSDIPAFKVLRGDQSYLMRPTGSVPEPFSAIVSFYPDEMNVGFEVSPTFNKRDFYSRGAIPMSFSLAYSRHSHNSENIQEIGTGLKISLTRLTSYRSRVDLERYAREEFFIIEQAKDSLMLEFARSKGVPLYAIFENPNLNTELDQFLEFRLEELRGKNISGKIRQKIWNDFSWDIGFASLFSNDTTELVNQIHSTRFSLWNSVALPLGRMTQAVFGVNWNYERAGNQERNFNSFAINGRFYIGSNKTKLFAEYQYVSYDENNLIEYQIRSLVNVGGEINLFQNFWFDLSAGVASSIDGSDFLTTSFHIRTSLPEKFQFN
ncbi:MAG: hypothetical protein ABJO02_20045 [Reichenbachiella sp.]|uniref:hypothetical protein n=1 Tax=Reichenbachiella sp. TaxID=2184521 RepID=UPI0032971AAF